MFQHVRHVVSHTRITCPRAKAGSSGITKQLPALTSEHRSISTRTNPLRYSSPSFPEIPLHEEDTARPALAKPSSNKSQDSLSYLRPALERKDIQLSWGLWSSAVAQVQLLGRAQQDLVSRLLTALWTDEARSGKLSKADILALERMSLDIAVCGSTGALQTAMLHYVQLGTSDSIHLYDRYKESKVDKGRQVHVEGTNCSATNTEEVTSTKTASSYNPHPDIILAFITACAQAGEFRLALTEFLESRIRIPQAALQAFTKRLHFDKSLRAKTNEYAHCLIAASLVSEPTAFTHHMANLIRDRSDKSMLALYTILTSALAEPQPWLVVEGTDSRSENKSEIPVTLPSSTWTAFLTGFLRCRRMDLAEKLWDDMIRFGVTPGMGIWVALLEEYTQLKMMDRAAGAWNVMKQQGLIPSPLAYRAFIEGWFRVGNPEEALLHFRQFQSHISRFSDDPSAVLVVYNTTLHRLLFRSDESEARRILEQMRDAGPKPDVVTFNTFLRYYGKKNDLKSFASILGMLDVDGLSGDVFTYSTALATLIRFRKDAPDIVFKLMERQGVKPNVAMYSSIIDHLMKEQTESAFKAALDILKKMEADPSPDVQPNQITYTSILAGIHRKSWLTPSAAEEYKQFITNKMKERNLMISAVTYNILIKACLENPDAEGLQNALRYFRDMGERRIFISPDTWYILLHGLMDRKEWALADELVREIRRSGFRPPDSLANLMNRVRTHFNVRPYHNRPTPSF